MAVCSSCGRSDPNFTVVKCPQGSCDGEIIRCSSCRKNENKYTCGKCGYTGP